MDIFVGKRIGELTVIQKLEKKWNNYDRWKCLCDCGNTMNTNSYSLKKGVTNCGKRLGHTEDISNKIYGLLTVIKKTGKNKYGSLWLCKCICGERVTVEKRRLISGNKKNCGCISRVDFIGKKFGSLKVIKLIKGVTKKVRKWECECICGRIVKPSTTQLQKGLVTDCGYCSRYNLEGKVFGKLTVLKILQKNKHNNRVYVCLCECGKKVKVISSSLRNGSTTSCGCNRNLYHNKIDLIQNKIFRTYKRRADKKELDFNLTLKEFIEIIEKNCYYCEAPPENEVKVKDETYHYNGIDRKNNNKGYFLKNCVTCCAFCNMAKGADPYQKFVEWGKRVSKYAKLNWKNFL